MKSRYFADNTFTICQLAKICLSSMLLSFCFSFPLSSQPFFWGLTEGGGCNDAGSLFEYNVATRTSVSRHDFNFANNGYSPEGGLLEYGNKFYGMCASGGYYNQGTSNDVWNAVWNGGVIFRFDPYGGGQYDVIHHFDIANGSLPAGDVIEYEGKLYGMTSHGGTSNQGVLFEFDLSSSVYAVLHHFTMSTGAHPYASLIESNGSLYGTTTQGGSANGGVIFKYEVTSGTYSALYNFTGASGAAPWGNLLEIGTDFYGLAGGGPNNGNGVIYKYNPITNVYSVLHAFSGSDGAFPVASLIGYNGKLYGTTRSGGTYNNGVLFEFDLSGSGSYVALHSFNFSDGDGPGGTLLVNGSSVFGLVTQGGAQNMGVLYEYNLANDVFTKMDFTGLNGAYPAFGKLIVGPQCQNCEVDNDGVSYACDNCPETWNPNQADCDNDGVGDVCDQCPGLDNSIDNNNDGEADCHSFPGVGHVPAHWLCGNNNTKVIVCHNGNEICVSTNAVNAHLAHGDFLGPCNNSGCGGENFAIPLLPEISIDNNETELTSLSVFPNPSTGDFSIHIENFEGKAGQLIMHDALGRKVWSEHVNENASIQIQADQLSIGAGVYWLTLTLGNEIKQARVIIY